MRKVTSVPVDAGLDEKDGERLRFIHGAIADGAMAFLKQEYKFLAIFMVVFAAIIAILIDDSHTPDYREGIYTAIAFLFGAAISIASGYIGMMVATQGNARTTVAAKKNISEAFDMAINAGAVMGFALVGLAALGLVIIYVVMSSLLSGLGPENNHILMEVIAGFGLGGSTIALFARVGGGIFTKAADVGADLVGKVEKGIPEDDPRNPAVIADNVGDNVGDVAGMGADLFESYAGSIIAPVSLIAFAGAGGLTAAGIKGDQSDFVGFLMFPMAIAFVGMIASIIGSFLVKGGDSTDSKALSKALHLGTNVAMGLTILATIGIAFWMFGDIADATDGNPIGLAISVIGGLVVGWALGKTAEYYTSDHFGPVKKIAQQSETGPATTVLGGVSAGMVSVAASVGLILVGVLVAYWGGELTLGEQSSFAGIYGIAVAAIGMLATTGVVVSVDAYGPIADNAGGIAEMAELDPSVREVTDALDSLGNTTAAVAKGFAVGSAALTALALFKSFEYAVIEEGGSLSLNVGDVDVFIGLFIGAGLPFLFAALTIASGDVTAAIVAHMTINYFNLASLSEAGSD